MTNAAVLTISDSVSAGTRADRSGPAVRERLEQLGWSVSVMEIIPDEACRDQRAPRHAGRWRTGGRDFHHRRHRRSPARRDAGSHPRHSRPRNPGIRRTDARPRAGDVTPLAALSRSLAGTRGQVLIVNLPGSPKGAVESLDAIVELVPHVLELAQRADRARGRTPGIACLDLFLLTLVCGLFCRPNSQQQPQPRNRRRNRPSRPPYSAPASKYVQAPVLVFDRDGNYVDGLRPDQFHLFDNGKEQNIHVDVTFTPISMVICLQANAHVRIILPQVKQDRQPDQTAADRRSGRGRRHRLRFARPHPAGLYFRPRQDHQGGEEDLPPAAMPTA